jgi:integrase
LVDICSGAKVRHRATIVQKKTGRPVQFEITEQSRTSVEASYGTHSMRRTKAAQIYRRTCNLRAVQLLLGHTRLESTVRYLGIEVDDALNIAEQIDIWSSTTGSMPVVAYATATDIHQPLAMVQTFSKR